MEVVMKKLSQEKLSEIVRSLRKEKGLTQADLAKSCGINRSIISRLELSDYKPSLDQLEALAEVLGFEISDLFCADQQTKALLNKRAVKIAVAGTGYVGLSLAVLLA